MADPIPIEPDPLPDLTTTDLPPFDVDFLDNNDLNFMDELDFDISFDDLTFSTDATNFLHYDENQNQDNYNSSSADWLLNSDQSDPNSDSGPVSSHGSKSVESVVDGFLNSPSPETESGSGSATSSPSPHVEINVDVKVEEEPKTVLKRKKDEENERLDSNSNVEKPTSSSTSNPNKLRKATSASVSSSAVTSSENAGMPEEDKKKARLMRNRESAQLSRQRKKHYVEELEDKVRSMASVITDLNGRISYMMSENVSLRQQLSGAAGAPPQPGVYPPPPPGMGYPWVPCGGYPMRSHGSQVPLVPIPRLKPRQPIAAPKVKKSDSKKGESKVKKVSSVTFLGLMFFMFLFCGLVPLVNVRYDGKMETNSVGFGFGSDHLRGQRHGRVLTVDTGLNKSHPGVEVGYHSGKSDLRECAGDRVNCRNMWVEGKESKSKPGKQGSQTNGIDLTGNASEPLVASLYVPRNDKLVQIDGNLIIHSFLASEKAMASRATHDKTRVSPNNESSQNGLAIADNLAAAVSVSNDGRHVESHPHMYRSSSVRHKALNSGSRDRSAKDSQKSAATEGSLQKWFREGLAGPILSSGMCSEVFQFDTSPSANPGGIVPASPAAVNVSAKNDSQTVNPSKKNRRFLNKLPIPLAEFNHTIPSQSGDLKNKTGSSMVVSILADPREAGDIEVDGGISPKTLSRIFVVVLIDSVKYVTYSCMLPFKGASSHLVN